MINFDYVIKGNIPDNPFRILIITGFGPGKTNHCLIVSEKEEIKRSNIMI